MGIIIGLFATCIVLIILAALKVASDEDDRAGN